MAAPRVIALDLGGTKLLAGIVDAEGVVARRVVDPTDTSSQDALLQQIDAAVSELLEDDIGAIGIGVPSLIDQRKGEAVESVNIPLHGLALRDHLHERFGLRAAIENDGNAAAVAEHRIGAGRGSRHMVMLTLGTGVGGGLILDGRL
jgi:glucokinase